MYSTVHKSGVYVYLCIQIPIVIRKYMAQYKINTKIYLYEVKSYLLDTISPNYIC